jgi:hypothetical protein
MSDTLKNDIHRLFLHDAELTDVIGILYALLERIEVLEKQLKEPKP